MIGREARVHVADPLVAANQQAGADQQHHRQRHLADDERLAHAACRSTRPRRARRSTRTRATPAPVVDSAGTRPKTTLVSTAIAIVNASTRQSTPTSPRRGMLAGPERDQRPRGPVTRRPARRRRRPARARRSPRETAAPAAAGRLRARRAPPPRGVRPLARASSRFATLTQATSSTSVTAPSRISSAGRMLRTMRSCRPIARHHAILVGPREVARQPIGDDRPSRCWPARDRRRA